VRHARIHGHHRAAADDVAASALAGVLWSAVVVLRSGRAGREETRSRGSPSRRRGLQEIAPPEMVLRIPVLAKNAHCVFLPRRSSGMTTLRGILLPVGARVHPIAPDFAAVRR